MSDICEAPSAARNSKDEEIEIKPKSKSKSNLFNYL